LFESEVLGEVQLVPLSVVYIPQVVVGILRLGVLGVAWVHAQVLQGIGLALVVDVLERGLELVEFDRNAAVGVDGGREFEVGQQALGGQFARFEFVRVGLVRVDVVQFLLVVLDVL